MKTKRISEKDKHKSIKERDGGKTTQEWKGCDNSKVNNYIEPTPSSWERLNERELRLIFNVNLKLFASRNLLKLYIICIWMWEEQQQLSIFTLEKLS
jgi:hypothetical protein